MPVPSPTPSLSQPSLPPVGPLELVVTFINVGKADSILVQQGANSMLIDAGTTDMVQTVIDTLHQHGVTSLDLVILTHSDTDHVGGMADVLNEFPVKKVLLPPAAKLNTPFSNLMQYVDDHAVPIETPKPNSKGTLGTAQMTYFAPNNAPYADNNNNSIVFRLAFGATSFLFEGDALQQSEEEMLSRHYHLASTVLKVSHHGRDDASSLKFLKAVKPKYAVISDCPVDEGGYTSTNVLKNLAQIHAKVFSTAYSGTIVATSDGKKVTFN